MKIHLEGSIFHENENYTSVKILCKTCKQNYITYEKPHDNAKITSIYSEFENNKDGSKRVLVFEIMACNNKKDSQRSLLKGYNVV